ncbi:GNAT family N-acetyltransferase [Clostridium ihumii]|uniref:GNAT family N-acetyltransferase n=1 Tax=Clostridium ihumii TaxID=1470356 RepID=UPI000687A9AC|nr:GNAT family protein [Clostridium ihumii]
MNNLILRDRNLKDIDDYIDWYTVNTEWKDYDAPWEKDEEINLEKIKQCIIKEVQNTPKIKTHFEIESKEGKHIGRVSSYYINGDKEKLAVGIDIINKENRGKGLGYEALLKFIKYILSNITNEVYTETWSGNERMIKLALKLGFKEINRDVDLLKVNGKYYDSITFKLDNNIFNYLYNIVI